MFFRLWVRAPRTRIIGALSVGTSAPEASGEGTAGGRWDTNCVGSCYGASGWQTSVNRIEVMETNAGSALAIKTVQVLSVPAIAFGAPSTLDLEWVY